MDNKDPFNFTDASVYQQINPEPSGVRFWYQRNRKYQRLILLIPASVADWIDTHLQPQVLGTRLVFTTWNAKLGTLSPTETKEQFIERSSKIHLRFVPDPSRVEKRRIYIASGIDEPTLMPLMREMPLRTDDTTILRFPSEPGIIQIRLAGSRPTDRGNTRIEFAADVVDDEDWFIYEHSIKGRVDFLDVPTDAFHPLPPLPEP
jgi:hypothetical protein